MLIDSDVLVWLTRGHPGAAQRLNEIHPWRISVVTYSELAQGCSVETLIGEKAAPTKRGPTPKMQQQIERLSRLPQAKQRVVMEMLEGFLNQASRGP